MLLLKDCFNISRNQFGWVMGRAHWMIKCGNKVLILLSENTRQACFSLAGRFCFLCCLTVHSCLICLQSCFCVASHNLLFGWNDLTHWQSWVLLVFYLLLCLFTEHRHISLRKTTTNQSSRKMFLTWKTVEFIGFLVIAMTSGVANE